MYKNFFNAYKDFWLKATEFNSKTTRSDWWSVQLANIIISIFTIPIFLRTFGLTFMESYAYFSNQYQKIKRILGRTGSEFIN